MAPNRAAVFVGGPIQHAIQMNGHFDREARSIIESVISALEAGSYHIFSAHLFEKFGLLDVSNKFEEVCARDWVWMEHCDVFVAVLPLDTHGKVIFSAGTAVELGWASAKGKPIVLAVDERAIYSHLILGLSAVARVTKVDISRDDFANAVRRAVDEMLM